MNNARRKRINKIIGELQELMADVETLGEEEQEVYDNMPESLSGSDRGQATEAAAQKLQDAAASLEAVIAELEEAAE